MWVLLCSVDLAWQSVCILASVANHVCVDFRNTHDQQTMACNNRKLMTLTELTDANIALADKHTFQGSAHAY